MASQMLATGAGAAEGLETLMARLRAEEAMAEAKRSNLAGEALQGRNIEETSGLRRATLEATNAERMRAEDARMRDDVINRLKLRTRGSEVTQPEYDVETKYGAPSSLYEKSQVTPFSNDFMGPIEPSGPQRGESLSKISFTGTADQQMSEDRLKQAEEIANLRQELAQDRENRLRNWGPPVIQTYDPTRPGGSVFTTRANAPGMTAPPPAVERTKLDAYKTTLDLIGEVEQFPPELWQKALGPFDANVGRMGVDVGAITPNPAASTPGAAGARRKFNPATGGLE